MNNFDTRVMTEPEVVRSMIVKNKNEISVLHVNNIYLETLKLQQTSANDAYELKRQLKANRDAIAENKKFVAFLERLADDVRVGQFEEVPSEEKAT